MVRSATAASRDFGLSNASPIPILITTFSTRGTCIIFLKSNALRKAGTTSLLYVSCILFIDHHSAANRPVSDNFCTHDAHHHHPVVHQHGLVHHISGKPALHWKYQSGLQIGCDPDSYFDQPGFAPAFDAWCEYSHLAQPR